MQLQILCLCGHRRVGPGPAGSCSPLPQQLRHGEMDTVRRDGQGSALALPALLGLPRGEEREGRSRDMGARSGQSELESSRTASRRRTCCPAIGSKCGATCFATATTAVCSASSRRSTATWREAMAWRGNGISAGATSAVVLLAVAVSAQNDTSGEPLLRAIQRGAPVTSIVC